MTFQIDEFSFSDGELRLISRANEFENLEIEYNMPGSTPIIVPTCLSSEAFTLTGYISGPNMFAIDAQLNGVMRRSAVYIGHSSKYIYGNNYGIWAKPTGYSVEYSGSDGNSRLPLTMKFKIIGTAATAEISELIQTTSVSNEYDFV